MTTESKNNGTYLGFEWAVNLGNKMTFVKMSDNAKDVMWKIMSYTNDAAGNTMPVPLMFKGKHTNVNQFLKDYRVGDFVGVKGHMHSKYYEDDQEKKHLSMTFWVEEIKVLDRRLDRELIPVYNKEGRLLKPTVRKEVAKQPIFAQ